MQREIATTATDEYRKQLQDELLIYTPSEDAERIAKAEMLNFLMREPRCFDRGTAEGHFTASACIVDRRRTSMLLLFHKRFARWVQPGGHADGDGDLRRVALREAREETGLTSLTFVGERIFDVHIFRNPGTPLAPVHFDIRFLMLADRDERPQVNAESHRAAWISLDAIAALNTDASVLGLAAKLTLLRSPQMPETSGS